MESAYSLPRQTPVASLSVGARATFIMRTYLHLLGAIMGFVVIEMFLFNTGMAYSIAQAMLSVSWLLVLGGFIIVGWFASRVAFNAQTPAAQYAALVGFVVAEALIFVPLLVIAELYAPGAIQSAAVVTILGFAGLTGVVFVTRKDFSFLGGMLRWGFIVAIVLIVGAVLFGFELGTYFSVGMIALAGAAILYDTSNVLNHFPEDRYVGAALELFASVALLFWYVLSLFISRD